MYPGGISLTVSARSRALADHTYVGWGVAPVITVIAIWRRVYGKRTVVTVTDAVRAIAQCRLVGHFSGCHRRPAHPERT